MTSGGISAKFRRAWHIGCTHGLPTLARKIAGRLTRYWHTVPPPRFDDLRITIDSLPRCWQIGKGNVLPLTGSCYHPFERVSELNVLMGEKVIRVSLSCMTRAEVFKADYPELDPLGHSLHSGFAVMIPVPECVNEKTLRLCLQARLNNGQVIAKGLGEIDIRPTTEKPSLGTLTPAIAVCMTTCNPDPKLFARQLESIRGQTETDWICFISDDCSRPRVFEEIVRLVGKDQRFVIHRNAVRLGFYHNFERCLSLVPEGVEFIALSDHDDWWQPGKLAALRAEFDDETTLVYSDMHIVGSDGRRIAETYWTNRRNNFRNLGSLFLTNTITGAASMFRRRLLEYLLPFHDKIGTPFHDHWIGCTALTLGKIKYIDRPLYDYVQHGGNVIGHYVQPRPSIGDRLRGTLGAVLPWRVKAHLKIHFAQAKAIYFNDLRRIQHLAQILQLRAPATILGSKAATLERLARLDTSWRTIGWLLIRGLAGLRRRNVTMGAETCLLRGIWWRKCMSILARLRTSRWGSVLTGPVLPRLRAAVQEVGAAPREDGVLDALDRVEAIQQKIMPLVVTVAESAPRRVNLLLPTIDFNYVFGGYITKFNLARCLAEKGYHVRILAVDYCDFQPARWRQQLAAYPGLERLLDAVEIVPAFPRKPIEFHPRDAVIATTWWTAHIAHGVVRALGRERFTYLIQEFEPFTFAMGSCAALADQSYMFPHHAVFSTELLRDYFRGQGIGVFAQGRDLGDRHSISFENTITAVGSVSARDLAGRSSQKLLYYARPEKHAARNMFELGIAALMQAVREGCFAKDWELFGIGTVGRSRPIPLGNGVSLQLLPRKPQDSYRDVLRAHDLGLALMYTPHPSLVPIEMASAGMWTVTNTYANKTATALESISSNLIAVPPTIDGVVGGLKTALARIADHNARARGAQVAWSTSWDQSFRPSVLGRIEEFLDCDDRDQMEALAA